MFISYKFTVYSGSWHTNQNSKIKNQQSLISFFFLDEKETKNQDLDFRPSTSGSLPKTQKLARSLPHVLRQLVFLNGPETSGSPSVPTLREGLPNPMVEEVFVSTLLVVAPKN